MFMVGWLVAAVSHAAEPVFVPDFTPATGEEFAIAVMLQGMVVDQLLKDGDVVLTNDVVAPILGADKLAACANRPECPGDLLPQLPSRVAIVGKVERVGAGTLVGNVYLYEVGQSNPVDSLYVPIAPGNEHIFAADVSKATQTLLARLGPSPDDVLLAAARLIAGQPAASATPAPVVSSQAPGAALPAPAPSVTGEPPVAAPKPFHRYDGSTPHTGDLDEILGQTGVMRRHLVGSEGAFRKAGLDPRDWVYRTMPHAGRVTFEIRAGVGLGDVDRDADVRIELQSDTQTNAWYQEGPVPNRRVRGDLYVGYAPATMVDIGVLGGLQYGHRTLTTGIEWIDADGALIEEQVFDAKDIQAVQLYLQPRVRAYLVPLGPVKPFLFTGADLRIFDGYHIDQPAGRAYPAPGGGVMPGWVGGGGMMIDPGPIVGLFAEGMYIRHFGALSEPRQYTDQGAWPHAVDPLGLTSGITVGVTGGVQFRL
ncbi:MAG: hypothetical protein ABMB14_04845 [Myxococcota bacterium]